MTYLRGEKLYRSNRVFAFVHIFSQQYFLHSGIDYFFSFRYYFKRNLCNYLPKFLLYVFQNCYFEV